LWPAASIKPVHSDAIYDGSKTVELRRRFPLVRPGTPVVVYNSSPTMEVSGEFCVASVTVDDVAHT
jgi:predicted transcriptional regulator